MGSIQRRGHLSIGSWFSMGRVQHGGHLLVAQL